eukprot:m.182372 g.182372  ORF g.182372 m.182372 type:complete len:434 (+) comp24639_c0_seq1:848-2149(+)
MMMMATIAMMISLAIMKALTIVHPTVVHMLCQYIQMTMTSRTLKTKKTVLRSRMMRVRESASRSICSQHARELKFCSRRRSCGKLAPFGQQLFECSACALSVLLRLMLTSTAILLQSRLFSGSFRVSTPGSFSPTIGQVESLGVHPPSSTSTVSCDTGMVQSVDCVPQRPSHVVCRYCSKCSTLVEASLRPCLLHTNSATIGFVDTRRCRVVDVLPSDLHAACADCNTEYLLSRVKRGVRTEHACFDCHHKLAFEAKLVRIDEHSVEDVPAAGRKAGGNGGKKEKAGGAGPRIVEGHELPNLGSCDHFKKSLRWLRFPCCGKACACPVCHELDGCESLGTIANRMICGKCSCEQNFGNRPCESCGFHMGKGRGGASHWSGGGGSRNFSQLSRKDHRKNKGVSRSGAAKTVSQKSKRVGVAGKKAVTKPKSTAL